MKELVINGVASGVYHIDLGDAGDRASWERILLDDSARAGPGNSHRLTLQAGNLLVYDLRNGRGVGSKDDPHILFQPSVSSEVWAGLCGVSGDPVCCPFCGGRELSAIDADEPTLDGVSGCEIAEWQCRGNCEGRSFWV